VNISLFSGPVSLLVVVYDNTRIVEPTGKLTWASASRVFIGALLHKNDLLNYQVFQGVHHEKTDCYHLENFQGFRSYLPGAKYNKGQTSLGWSQIPHYAVSFTIFLDKIIQFLNLTWNIVLEAQRILVTFL